MTSRGTAILRNLTSMTAMRVITAALSLGLISLIAKRWGAIHLGEFSTLFTYFMFLQQLPLLGLHIVIARTVASDAENSTKQSINALFISLAVAAILMLGIGLIGRYFYPPSMHSSFWLVGFSCIPSALIVVIEAILIGREQVRFISRVNIIENLLRTLACMVIVLGGGGLTLICATFFFGRWLAVLLYWRNTNIIKYFVISNASKERIRELVRMSPTFLGIMFFSAAFGRFDFILL